MKIALLLLTLIAGTLQAQEISHTTQPLLLHKVGPAYTPEASQAKLEGKVVLSALIDGEGKPTNIKVVSPLGKGLDEKAVEAFGQWRFMPARKHGEVTAAKVTIEMNFRLPQTAAKE